MRYPQDVTLNFSMPTTLGASAATTPVSKAIALRDPSNLRVDILITAATLNSGSITLTLQTSAGVGSDGKTMHWNTTKTAVVTGSDITTDTWETITVQSVVSGDQAYTPLPALARVVAATGSGQAITIGAVRALS